ncbi:MAG: putative toxin-antitoxin system toxin component, PIN family [Chitinophagaceae bacterium]|nr:putative toxin-antitoxin system toxin component, PIN family [Chitinophagaceae bacterium]MCW5904281.1 putative toxin-antitoxin system toxin component, PIN family [Chitinophagaceae bacterium]
MKAILDTNILLIVLPTRSPYHKIIQAFNNNRVYQLVITTPIFLEYEEMLSKKANSAIANIVLAAFFESPNVIVADTYYRWKLITSDMDDNKFTDAYLNGEADYLVTNDTHFNIVKTIKFPNINIVSADEFLEILKNTT